MTVCEVSCVEVDLSAGLRGVLGGGGACVAAACLGWGSMWVSCAGVFCVASLVFDGLRCAFCGVCSAASDLAWRSECLPSCQMSFL